MITLFLAFAAAAQAPVAAPASPSGAPADADPVVCQRPDTSEVGTHMRPKRVCMRKSDWDIVEKRTKEELQRLSDHHLDPGRAEGHP